MPSISRQKAIFYDYLARKGLKSTAQREVILDTFLRSKGHIPIEELLRRVRRKHSNIGYTTVYRTLKLMLECGIAKERNFSGTSTVYETTDESHHDHIICLQCGKIVEFEDERIEALQEEIAARHGFRLFRHKHELYGYCAPCQQEGTPSPDAQSPEGAEKQA
ncbi:MAG: transcriptional repressor [Deltaproteobacteria bacterium]|nr:MAG: transcriptional repressor [Deltaproteobacteria bacterium]